MKEERMEKNIEKKSKKKNRRKLSGSLLAKIIAFFILAISTMASFASMVGTILMAEANAYNYQNWNNSVQVVAREMMVDYAWRDMHMIRQQYEIDDADGFDDLEEYSKNKNYTVELYEGQELLWGNYNGEETPYSFRYEYSKWVEVPVSEENERTPVQSADEELDGIAVESVMKEYTVRLYVDPDFPYDDEYYTTYYRAVLLCEGMYVYPIVAIGGILLSIICFIFLMCGAGHKNGKEGITPGILTAIHFDVLTVAFGSVAVMAACLAAEAMSSSYGSNMLAMAIAALFGGFEIVWCTIYLMDFAVRLKLGAWWKHTLIAAILRVSFKIIRMIGKGLAALVKGLPLVLNVVIIFLGICILEFLGLCWWCRSGELVMVWFLEKMVLFPIVLYFALVCKKLQEGSEALAEGNLSFKLDTTKMVFGFKEHGENLNQIGKGISKAVEERMKSEHLKTELITNVSHDLKTPLTSIINYADLLVHEVQPEQKESLSLIERDSNLETGEHSDKIAEYAEVLHRQSKRLKKLLEDLVEASKATTGALEVNLQQCEIGVLLSQAVGEYEQRFAEKQLQLIVRQPEEPVRIMADGRHLWRVFDNLLNNICKYAQENTRVYLSVNHRESHVEIIFRNMSKYALDISAEELEERFVRGDKSRHMEGNGLGLSIAKSLVALQNGRMEIVTDGDLFKVILHFKAIMFSE